MLLTEVVMRLAEKRISHTIVFASKDTAHWTIQISDSLNNEQLKTTAELGGSMIPNGVVFLNGEGWS
jgi:hypothetical protein